MAPLPPPVIAAPLLGPVPALAPVAPEGEIVITQEKRLVDNLLWLVMFSVAPLTIWFFLVYPNSEEWVRPNLALKAFFIAFSLLIGCACARRFSPRHRMSVRISPSTLTVVEPRLLTGYDEKSVTTDTFIDVELLTLVVNGVKDGPNYMIRTTDRQQPVRIPASYFNRHDEALLVKALDGMTASVAGLPKRPRALRRNLAKLGLGRAPEFPVGQPRR